MIQLLATRYNKHIAFTLGFIFYLGMLLPAYSMVRIHEIQAEDYVHSDSYKEPARYSSIYSSGANKNEYDKKYPASIISTATPKEKPLKNKAILSPDEVNIGGPSQPEMSSFKPAGTNDMVNLFTGDFSYNIPLLDVGGYPVNIFYDGGITMEQEASWVGLGWNINPGNVNRNMRGVPDDFNGEEKLIQSQNMKKNITWGVSMGADLELVGSKQWNQFFRGTVGASVGYSLNNYLGPAIELGIKGTTSFSLTGKGISEKGPIGVSMGLNANLNSRAGLTFTPNISLAAQVYSENSSLSFGVGLSTSYNSRAGIKGLQLSEQTSMNYTMVSKKDPNSYYNSSMGGTIFSSSISFTKPSYIPAMRSVITNSSGAGRFQIGGAMFGIYPSFEIEGYGQVSSIESADQTLKKPMIGYLYAEKAKNNRDAVMDFTRFNDQEVTPTTSVISVPQYAYDVFSIQGEGTGGTIRAYRNDNGYVRDNFTASKDKSWSAGVDVGVPGHLGTNFNTVKTPSTIGEWNNGNKLRNTIGFGNADGNRENVYFRNPGENSVLESNQYDSIGGTNLVRYKLGGTNSFPTIEPKLQKINSNGVVIEDIDVQKSIGVPGRKKRTQVTSFLTASEASDIGLDKKIKVYNADPLNFLDTSNKLNVVEQIDRVSDYRKAHHISQINITEADGKRYIYDIPVYNIVQKDFSFTVADNCNDCDVVPFTPDDALLTSSHITSGVGGKDGYTQITETPPYAHSFLLSGLLSPDYVDVKGDGITEDDLGGAVKFNYTKVGVHNWRTPLKNNDSANSNPGNLSETRDDKGLVSYGQRESWYLHSVESKTMIAFFTLENRSDGKGVGTVSEFDNINYNDNSLKRLKQIDLYNKAELKKNGLAGARPVKTVHFGYSNSLCANTPDNQSGGKLTLDKIWFTYNGQTRGNKNQYLFSYIKGTTAVPGENPSYAFNASDRWGNYKPFTDNPQSMKNRDYPYSIQDKTTADKNANAWALKKILLPSGGQLEVEYESDDYAFVQDKRAAVMSGIIGFSNSNANPTNKLYVVNGNSVTENDYIFIKVTDVCNSRDEVYQKYLQGMKQLAVKLLVIMPKGSEYLTSYATIADYGVYTGAGTPAIWIRMNTVMDKGIAHSPLSTTAIEFLRERLPAQAFKSYDVSEGTALEQLKTMFDGLIQGIGTAFSNIPESLRRNGKAQTVELNKSFVRLNDPDGYKYGGGQRVKKVTLKDNWKKMTNPNESSQGYTSVYGQQYDYTTTEVFNAAERTISSGVASYEPSIGGEENPFQSIVQISNEVPLGPTSYGAIEMPVMDAFFPAPLVGYSKVTVTSIGKQQNPDPANKKTRSGVGRQVTEFYTAKDFPVYYNNTALDPASDKQEHINPTLTFLYKHASDSRAISQGFIIATNDMNGKMKSQSSYAENDPASRISYTQNFYRNTGVNGLEEKFDFVHNTSGGEIKQGNMGIDIELMTDTREFSLKSHSFEIQAQVDWMIPPIPPIFPVGIWLPFIWPVVSESENTYRAVTTTKVISYHAVLDSVVVIDKGSQVSTKNLAYDAETGQVVVNRTNNEFDKSIYSVSYPAYWAYSGMGLAYKNIDAVYSAVNFLDGKIISNNVPASILESGDELYIMDAGSAAGCDPSIVSPPDKRLIWAFNKNKNTGTLTDINPDLIFIDENGNLYNRSAVKFRIVRSGKRNMLQAPVAAITLMTNPFDPTTNKLTYNTNSKIINASAIEYKEKWQTDNDAFYRYRVVMDPLTCAVTKVEDCTAGLEKEINPYRKGLLGNFRSNRSMVFYGDRTETNPINPTNLLQNGFLTGFNPYWNFNIDNNLVPDINNLKWVWNVQSTRFNSKGMELETKDALNIYTAAQYGYSKTLPTAIANNSRYDEMAYEGFEDNDYNDLLNNSVYNSCAKRHIDFAGLTNGQIVNTESAGFNAHTGKRILGVNAGSVLTKQVNIKQADDPEFGLVMQSDITKSLSDPGGNYQHTFANPTNVFDDPGNLFIFSGNQPRSDIKINPIDDLSGGNRFHYYSTSWNFYIEVTEAKTYSFSLSLSTAYNNGGISVTTHSNSIAVVIRDLQDNFVNSHTLSQNAFDFTSENYTTFLCPGIYKIEGFISEIYSAPNNGANYTSNNYSWECTNSTSLVYKSLTTQNGCAFTKPIATTDFMSNPTFNIPASKKMLFSAWVRESNTQVSTYANNEVQIDFGAGNSNNITLKPGGSVIEGWQRYEGYFTVPSSGATQMNLKLVNNSGSTIYFDDIRIHPFNANMKSYVYDPVNLRLKAELDANNYASFYEYDEEGTLIRTKVETRQGIKTVTESRSAKQKTIADFQ